MVLLTMLMDQRQKTHVFLILSITSTRSFFLQEQVTLRKIIYLSADAFGVLPPVSILDDKQAQYHFLCGYTSKLAGTERGITEPVPSFSPAFGEAFLTLHPTMYAKTLVSKMQEHGAKAYLVNTGWNGTGKRISIKNTRAIIDAIVMVLSKTQKRLLFQY